MKFQKLSYKNQISEKCAQFFSLAQGRHEGNSLAMRNSTVLWNVKQTC